MAAGATDVFKTTDRSVELNLNLSRRSSNDQLGQVSCNWLQQSIIDSGSSADIINGYNTATSSNYNIQLPEMEYLQSYSNYNYWASAAGGINYGTPNGNSLVWPPRSYSCNFCHRRFRSAQALGGHMNVHRRDRAKLYQNSSPPAIASAPSPSPARLRSEKNCTKNTAAPLSNGNVNTSALPLHQQYNPENRNLMDYRRSTNTISLSTSSSSPTYNYNFKPTEISSECNIINAPISMQISERSTLTHHPDESNITDINNVSDQEEEEEDELIDLELRLGQYKAAAHMNNNNNNNNIFSAPNPNPSPGFLKLHSQQSYIIHDDDIEENVECYVNISN